MKKNACFPAILLTFLLSGIRAGAQTNEPGDTAKSPKIYDLGVIDIVAHDDKTLVNSTEMAQFNKKDVANALQMLPSITLSNFGARNEATVYLRGFDMRQVPLFMDGIPVYVPYDGYVDLGRFVTADLSEINISKGFASVLYGPNTLGGAINLVSRKPVKKLEINALAGGMSGNGYRGNLNIGSNFGKFYVQAGVSKMEQQYFDLSKDFTATKTEDGGKRDNSYREDIKGNLKFGYTPNKTDEYRLCVNYQHGEKGIPVYTGSDASIKPRYWQYPYWDEKGIYFLSKTAIGKKSYIKAKAFFDQFDNRLNSFDDATCITQTKPYAFNSIYNDQTMGATLEGGTSAIKNNNVKIAVHFRNDRHTEHNVGEAERHIKDNTISFCVEDNVSISKKLQVIPGVSYDMRQSDGADNYNSSTKEITPFPSNNSRALNGQIGIFYEVNKNNRISITASNKTRFATMKDRYSYKMGIAIPNPDLKPENSVNYEIAYKASLFGKIKIQPALFYLKLHDVIMNIGNVQPGKAQMQNAGKAEFMGGDIDVGYTVIKNLKLNFNYTYLHRNNLTNSSLKFIDVPENKVFGCVVYKPAKIIEINICGEYNSPRYSASYGNKVSDYGLMNARVEVLIWKGISTELGMNNILDKNYAVCEGYPEAGRNYFGSLICKLN